MAIQDVIKRLIYQFSSTGADQVAADMGKVNAEQQKLAVNSEETTRASLDLEKSFANLERRFDSTIRAQQDYAKVQTQVNAAVAQHPELQERANNVLDLAAQKFEKAAGSSSVYSKAMEQARGAALGLAAGIGPVGAVLGSFGPWGVAAAAGIGLVATAFNYVKEQADKMGETSARLKDFADNTDLTVTQLRGLTQAGSAVGQSADQIGSAMQKFTANLADARQGSGALYDGLQRIDRGLAEQVATATSAAEAFDAVIKAINATTDATTRLNIARAAFGKGGAGMVGVAQDIGADAGGLNAYSDAVVKASGVSSEYLTQVAALSRELKDLKDQNELLKQSMASAAALQGEIDAAKRLQASLLAVKKAKDDIAAGRVSVSVSQGDLFPTVTITTQTAALGANTQARNDNTAATGAGTAAANTSTEALGAEKSQLDALIQSILARTQAQDDADKRAVSKSSLVVAALGDAATAQEKLTARLDAYEVAANKANLTDEQYNRGLNQIYENSQTATKAIDDQSLALQRQAASFQMAGAAARGWVADQTYVATSFASRAAGEPGSFVGSAGSPSGSSVSLNPFVSPYGYSGGQDISQSTTFADQVAAAATGGIQSALALAMGTSARSPTYAYDPNAPGSQGAMVQYGVTESDIVSQVTSLYQTLNQQNPAAQAANTQQEMAWLQSRPTSLAQQQAIAQLNQSLTSLTKSTDSLNATNQELLSPYYTQDPRTSHIGFRSQGMASGGYVDVPGGYSTNDNLIASIPVASGERIYVDPMTGRRGTAGGGNLTINISSPVMIAGNANKDDVGRTMFQSNQNLAKQLRGAM